ncbi:MAG: ParB/RepB/Spo0J family partition protein [Sulfurimonas sp.]
MAKLNLEQFKANADKIIQDKSTQGLFSESQNKLLILELELLQKNFFRAKLNSENIEALSESIDTFTQLEPIIVSKQKDGYHILDGHARVEAIALGGGESALCVVINATEENTAFYPYILNKSNLDEFEVAYYIDRLLTSGISEKLIQKKLGLVTSEHKKYNFEYNLFDILKNSEIITYEYLQNIASIKTETTRDETLDHIVQKLINQTEIENYLTKVREDDFDPKLLIKRDGVKIKKSGHKTSIDIDERQLSFDEINKFYDFISFMKE